MTKLILLVQLVLQLFVQSSPAQGIQLNVEFVKSMTPSMAPKPDHTDAIQSMTTTKEPDIASTASTKFDCSTHLTCTECVTSQLPCHWCFEAHRCTNDTGKNCHDDILVTNENYNGGRFRSGPGWCPRIDVTGEGQEIMVAYGTKKQVTVKVHIIGQFLVQTRYVCQFNIESRMTSVNAQHLGDKIICDELEFTYGAKTPNLTVTFTVIWGDWRQLENPSNIHVLIYRCKEMADSCGACLTLDEKYRCGWCSSSNTCEVEHQCGNSSKVEGQEKKDWLDSQKTCPKPEIHSFDPKTGPWEGGTNITIRGINLGKKFEDIFGGVKIAGIDCIPFRELYVQTKEIVCKMDGPGEKIHLSGKVVIQISDFREESTNDFAYVDPEITDFTPKIGPIAGGTIITIVGKNLNAGSRVKAYLGQHPCEISHKDEKEVVCRTTAVQSTLSGKLRMEFDNGVRGFNGDNFKYVPNPTIDYVSSRYPEQMDTIRGFPAGGIKIYVIGHNLFTIRTPLIYVYYRGRIFQNNCNLISNEEMQCLSPEIDLQEVDIFQSGIPLQLEYGFIMDDVQSVMNLSSKLESWYELYPNPVYYPLEKNPKHFNGEFLIIKGRDLDRVAKESDVTVTISDKMICNITSLTRDQLICRPPMDQDIVHEKVKVIVGSFLTYDVGQIGVWPSNTNDLIAWTVAIGFTILALLIVGFLIVCCKKTILNKHRVYKMKVREQREIPSCTLLTQNVAVSSL